MKTNLFILFAILSVNANAQAVRKKNLQFDFSTGIGLYHAYDNLWGRTAEPKINAGAILYSGMISFAPMDQFTIGIEVMSQAFLTDNTDSLVVNANGGSVLLRTDYHFLKCKKFTFYSGLGIGVAGIHYDRMEIDTAGNVTTGVVNGGGTRISPRGGIKVFFGKKNRIGLFLDYSFNAYTYSIENFSVNGTDREYMAYRKTSDVMLNVRGHEVKAGLTLKF